MKKTFYTEWAYVFGLLTLGFSTALMEKADFGLSMVIAPAYILHLKIVQFLPFFSFGMAGYTVEGLLILALIVVTRKAKLSYFLSFVTAFLYGWVLDGFVWLLGGLPADTIAMRLVCYAVGLVFCALGVSLMFHTYFAPEAYELFVKELSDTYGWKITTCKTCYDCISCAVAVCLSFAFFGFGEFHGVKLGTVFCALVNGWLIGRFSHLLERHFTFTDRLKARALFTK